MRCIAELAPLDTSLLTGRRPSTFLFSLFDLSLVLLDSLFSAIPTPVSLHSINTSLPGQPAQVIQGIARGCNQLAEQLILVRSNSTSFQIQIKPSFDSLTDEIEQWTILTSICDIETVNIAHTPII